MGRRGVERRCAPRRIDALEFGLTIVIGIFSGPLDAHYNRAPLTARIEARNSA